MIAFWDSDVRARICPTPSATIASSDANRAVSVVIAFWNSDVRARICPTPSAVIATRNIFNSVRVWKTDLRITSRLFSTVSADINTSVKVIAIVTNAHSIV